jgi:hypothetical protein
LYTSAGTVVLMHTAPAALVVAACVVRVPPQIVLNLKTILWPGTALPSSVTFAHN